MKIKNIKAREILDSRANPTIEVDVYLEDGSMGRAAIPSGASTGEHEAVELRDGEKEHYLGKGVDKAVDNIENEIASEILMHEFNQSSLDNKLNEIDGTDNKGRLGANAILGVSLAFAHAVANSEKKQLFESISSQLIKSPKMPRPMFNIMNGGRHADWATDIQEFMIIIENNDYLEQLESAVEVFHHLEELLKENGMNTNVGNEGGFAPGFNSNEQAFEFISQAVERAGFELGKDVNLALDIAASEFYDADKDMYILKTEGLELSKQEWLERIASWIEKYPLMSIEDPFDENDWDMWVEFTSRFGDKIQIVGDDLLVTNTERVKKAIELKACNALLVKVNQIGTLTETFQAMQISEQAGWNNIVSHRSGETEDVSISHIAVGTACGQIKTGAPSRGERTAKYNELIRISELL